MPGTTEEKSATSTASATSAEISATIVRISWLMRIAREYAYSNFVVRKELTEKEFSAIWLLSLGGKMPISALARFLRLSTDRTSNSLGGLASEELVKIDKTKVGVMYALTKKGHKRLENMVAASADRYQSMLASVGGDQLFGSDAELQTLNAVCNCTLERVEKHIKTWVIGQSGG